MKKIDFNWITPKSLGNYGKNMISYYTFLHENIIVNRTLTIVFCGYGFSRIMWIAIEASSGI